MVVKMFDDGMRTCLDRNKYLLEVINSLQVERSRYLKQINKLKKENEKFKNEVKYLKEYVY